MNRLLILCLLALAIAMALLVTLGAPVARIDVLLTLGGFMIFTGAVLEIRTRGLAKAMDRRTDERERARRDHAHRLAYWTLSFPIGFLVATHLHRLPEIVNSGFAVSPEAMPAFLVFSWLAVAIFLSLPTAIIAWTEPHPLDDDIIQGEPS